MLRRQLALLHHRGPDDTGSRSIRITLSVTRGSRSSIPSSATSRSFPPTASSSSRTTARSSIISSCAKSWHAPATRFARRPTPKCSSPVIGTGAGRSCRGSTASSRSRSTTGAGGRCSARATRTARSRSSITSIAGASRSRRNAAPSRCCPDSAAKSIWSRSRISWRSNRCRSTARSIATSGSCRRDTGCVCRWQARGRAVFRIRAAATVRPRLRGGARAEIHELLRQSVKRTFRADVPVGIAALRRPRLVDGARDPARGASDGAARTFTIRNVDRSYDESAAAALLAIASGPGTPSSPRSRPSWRRSRRSCPRCSTSRRPIRASCRST